MNPKSERRFPLSSLPKPKVEQTILSAPALTSARQDCLAYLYQAGFLPIFIRFSILV